MSDVFSHPWFGGLFADPEIEHIWSAERQLAHMLAFEAAYSRALGKAGVVDVDTATSAADMIEAFKPDMADLRKGTEIDGLPVPALVRQLKHSAGPLLPAVHAGTTSQDVLDTALALTLRSVMDLLAERLTTLISELNRLNEAFGSNALMGRTRMQAALPITVGDRIATWRSPLEGHHDRVTYLRPMVARIQLGGAVGDRRPLGDNSAVMADFMAAALGLQRSDTVWHSTRENITEFADLLSLISGSLGKLGQDICLMAQQGLDEIKLSGGGGSSAMPHKQNPILAELLVTLARFNATQISGMHQALVHEQERSGSAWALEWLILPPMTQATARALSASIEMCARITSIGGVQTEQP